MEPSKIFRQRKNDAKDIESIADDYKTKIGHELWLVDGLQKDVIQNSWDARIDKKHGEGWECGFSLINFGSKKILCISDIGTTGLNGTKFPTEDELGEILNRNEGGENLAYFLNSNWSAKTSEEGGNRGRGKTLFLAGSQDKKIFFDSYRSSDNTYLFGELYLDMDKQIKFRIDYGLYGEQKLKEFTDNHLSPLSQSGTRIFVLNPDESIAQLITSGEILSFISHSRWEILKKYQAKIFIESEGEKRYAILPQWYEDEPKGVESREFSPEVIRENTNYKTKRLVLRYAPNVELPEAIKGIAIQRSGMTIERLLAEDLVLHEEGMSDIYGWLEMENKPLEEEMKHDCEGTQHFDFNWTLKPAKYLREYLKTKIREFAKELKIISSDQSKKNKVQKLAEAEALKSLSPLFKRLGLFGHHKGTGKRTKSKRGKDETFRLSVSNIRFPRDNRRVNFWEKIDNAYVIPVNDSSEDIFVRIHVFVISKDGKTTIEIEEKEFILRPELDTTIGTASINISDKFKQGEYSFRAIMSSLEDTNMHLSDGTKIEKSTTLYRINLKFCVEMDLPEHGPFNFQPRAREDKNYLVEWDSDENGGYIIYYNILHPRIKILMDQNDSPKLGAFLTEQGALLAFQIKLEELIAGESNETDKELQELIKSKNIGGVWPIFLERYSEFLWELNK